MRLILIIISIRSDHGSGITILMALDGRRENGMLGIYEMFSRLINEDFTLSSQKTSGEIIKKRYS
jgi:hypothetical protein